MKTARAWLSPGSLPEALSGLATEGVRSRGVRGGGAAGRMLVATLADQEIKVIGIAAGKHVDAARAAGANHVNDRTTENVRDAVRACTGGCGVAAVFDPVGATTYETSLQLLTP